MDQPVASTVQRASHLMARREQHAKRMAGGQLPCQPAKVPFPYGLGSHFDKERNKIRVSFLWISDSGLAFPSLGFPLC